MGIILLPFFLLMAAMFVYAVILFFKGLFKKEVVIFSLLAGPVISAAFLLFALLYMKISHSIWVFTPLLLVPGLGIALPFGLYYALKDSIHEPRRRISSAFLFSVVISGGVMIACFGLLMDIGRLIDVQFEY